MAYHSSPPSLAFCVTGAMDVEPGFGRASTFTDLEQAAAFTEMFRKLRMAGTIFSIFASIDRLQYLPHPHQPTVFWRYMVSGRKSQWSSRELRGCGEVGVCKKAEKCVVPTLNASAPRYFPWDAVVANATARWGEVRLVT